MNALSLAVEILLVSIVTAQNFGLSSRGSWSSGGFRPGAWSSISQMSGSSSLGSFGGGGSGPGRSPGRRSPEQVIGSSILGRPLRMGELGLPRHGGAGSGMAHADGTRDGWDGNPRTMGMFRHSWTDPLGGRALPIGWNGDFRRINHLFIG